MWDADDPLAGMLSTMMGKKNSEIESTYLQKQVLATLKDANEDAAFLRELYNMELEKTQKEEGIARKDILFYIDLLKNSPKELDKEILYQNALLYADSKIQALLEKDPAIKIYLNKINDGNKKNIKDTIYEIRFKDLFNNIKKILGFTSLNPEKYIDTIR